MPVRPEDIDIRLAVGDPVGERPIKLICPMHTERLGVPDDVGSLAVYRDNVHCFGCGYHLRRRFAALAFLLGVWDGKGSEDGERCRAAVRRIQPHLQEFVSAGGGVAQTYTPPPPSPIMVEAFHQFLLTVMEDRLVDALMTERGLSLESVKRYKLGHTGTHFTIPLPNLEDGYYAIRFRADEQVVDRNDPGFRKYEGTWGRNSPWLFPLSAIRGLPEVQGQPYIGELWIVEGEFDAISGNQAGDVTLTVTNGAGSIDKLPGLLFDLLPAMLIGRWIIATDQDPAGEKAAEKLRSVLPGQSVTRARWPWGKDLTEYYSRGGSRKKIWYE